MEILRILMASIIMFYGKSIKIFHNFSRRRATHEENNDVGHASDYGYF